MRPKRLGETLPVRLPTEIDERIQKIAAATVLTKSAIIRMAVNHGLPEIEAGRLHPNLIRK
jgi:predicted DNA-binding protein